MAAYQLGRNGKLYLGTTLDTFAASGSPATVATTLADIADNATRALVLSGITGAPGNITTWAVWDNVADVTITRSAQEIDFTTRDSVGFDAVANVSKTVEISGTSNVRVDEMNQLAVIELAYENQVEVGFMALSATQDTALARGYMGNWNVTNVTESQPVKGIMTVQWTLKGSTIVAVTMPAS